MVYENVKLLDWVWKTSGLTWNRGINTKYLFPKKSTKFFEEKKIEFLHRFWFIDSNLKWEYFSEKMATEEPVNPALLPTEGVSYPIKVDYCPNCSMPFEVFA